MDDLLSHLYQQLTSHREGEGDTVAELVVKLAPLLKRKCVSENRLRKALKVLANAGKLVREEVQDEALDGKMRWVNRYRMISVPVSKTASPSRRSTSRGGTTKRG